MDRTNIKIDANSYLYGWSDVVNLSTEGGGGGKITLICSSMGRTVSMPIVNKKYHRIRPLECVKI